MNALPPSDGPIGIPPELRTSLGLSGTPASPNPEPTPSPAKKKASVPQIAARILLGVAVVGFVTYQNRSSENAGKFNDALIDAQEAAVDGSTPILESLGTETDAQVTARIDAYASANRSRISALEALDASGIDGGDAFRAKTIELIRGYDRCVGSFVPEMVERAPTFESEAQVREVGDALYEEHCGTIETIEKDLFSMQQQFAKDNDITLQ